MMRTHCFLKGLISISPFLSSQFSVLSSQFSMRSFPVVADKEVKKVARIAPSALLGRKRAAAVGWYSFALDRRVPLCDDCLKMADAMEVEGEISEVQALLEKARRIKGEGNDLFKAKSYRKAAIKYNQVFGYVNGLASATSGSYSQYAKPKDLLSDDQYEEVSALKIATCSNLCAVYIEIKKFEKVLKFADRALALNPTHVKVMYRKGQALVELRRFDLAVSVLKEAARLKSNDKNIRAAYADAVGKRKEWLKGQNAKEKAMFRGAFS